ncbi:Na/Pi cotransporter family protein [Aliidiomarina soli]|uniref:Na/Pi-cotransporter II-like protein n=1 Tax=Aliidiomarina soli TaxID=1928574 RepID=A0A432WD25_9GAMM|nr:Na/Pi symporter [Aliidiomarina soli]RUO30312.1 Na/Pi-cotransporter II-like protein [Aliidiomarina soli]
MMSFTDWAMSLGGLGFLLLGMAMMTEGLKAAAGDSLRSILERSTQTRPRALLTGFTLTAVVQSSSAVIMTTLGFTNAGMLTMRKAAWVVFGSNVGTTVTAWIVALIGLKVRVDAAALPMIGVGMLLHLFLQQGRLKHLGFALAGFGILFFGLGTLRDAFDNIADVIPVEQIAAAGGWGIVLGVLGGALLTVLMQSSSASLAIILTAAVTGVFTPMVGASLVIGANLGTTGTSLLASIGATANARRLAMVHVSQKAFTGLIALLLLWPMWLLVDYIADHTGGTITTALALFHTLFNVLGVLLMWLFSEYLFRRVERWIKQPELSSDKPRYLDKTVLSSPAMGVAAMHSELKRVFKQLLRRARNILQLSEDERDGHDEVNTLALLERIEEFGEALTSQANLAGSAETFLNLSWAQQELRELRLNLNELRKRPFERLHSAIPSELLLQFSDLLGSGQLKALSGDQREQALADIASVRKLTRRQLLAEIENGTQNAIRVTEYLAIIALCEDSAKRVIRIANILYPAPTEPAATT